MGRSQTSSGFTSVQAKWSRSMKAATNNTRNYWWPSSGKMYLEKQLHQKRRSQSRGSGHRNHLESLGPSPESGFPDGGGASGFASLRARGWCRAAGAQSPWIHCRCLARWPTASGSFSLSPWQSLLWTGLSQARLLWERLGRICLVNDIKANACS